MAKKDTPPPQDRWYYLQPGQKKPIGPLALEQLRTLVADNMLHKQTIVWRRGMFEWALYSKIDELKVNKSLFAAAFPALSPKHAQTQRAWS